jgi:hypothetical protein
VDVELGQSVACGALGLAGVWGTWAECARNLRTESVRVVPLHSKHLLTFLEQAVAGDGLTVARWTFLHAATGDVELALWNSAVVARNAVRMPVILFISISNARNGLPIERVDKTF